jgi:acetyltransferase-like isoleucine patch superfamily enzyme
MIEEQAPPKPAAKSTVSMPLYRGNTLKQMIKPFAVRLISAFWLAVYRARYGKRVRFGRNFITNGKLIIKGKGRVIFGDDVNAWSHAEKNVLIAYSPHSRIIIGDECRISGAGVQANLLVTVGPRCMLSSTIILDSDFHQLDPVLRHDTTVPVPCAPVKIEENVWVGGQSAILKGVTIGVNSVVAFRAVVTKDVPPNSVVAGNPAKVVKTIEVSS